MGTRADFYIGHGADAEWLGSIAWDGYAEGIPDTILYAADQDMFRLEVAEFLASRSDATVPSDGWPWPWPTSKTTDRSYWFFDGKCHDVQGKYMGFTFYAPFDPDRPEYDGGDEDEYYAKWGEGKLELTTWPDMSKVQNVTFGGRSGVIVL